jgi:hypothetical protein
MAGEVAAWPTIDGAAPSMIQERPTAPTAELRPLPSSFPLALYFQRLRSVVLDHGHLSNLVCETRSDGRAYGQPTAVSAGCNCTVVMYSLAHVGTSAWTRQTGISRDR